MEFSESINLTNEVQKYLGLYLGTQKLVEKVITSFLTKQLCNANPSLEITQFGPKVVLTFEVNNKFGVRLCLNLLGIERIGSTLYKKSTGSFQHSIILAEL